MGHAGRQTKRAPKSQSRGCSKARRDFASHVDRRHRVQMVSEGGCHSTCITAYHVIKFPLTSGRRRPCRDGGGGEIAPGFAMLIEQNALLTLIHQRHLTPSTPCDRLRAST